MKTLRGQLRAGQPQCGADRRIVEEELDRLAFGQFQRDYVKIWVSFIWSGIQWETFVGSWNSVSQLITKTIDQSGRFCVRHSGLK